MPYSAENIYQYLAHDIIPDSLDLQQKFYLKRRANNFLISYDILYIKKVIEQNGEPIEKCFRVVRSEEEKNLVIKTSHEGITDISEEKNSSRHLGINRTRRKITEKYWWPNMSSEIKKYVSSCSICKISLRNDKTPALPPAEVPLIPWCKLGMDIYNMSTTKSGYCALLVMIDYSSKWVHALPMQSRNATEVGQKLYEIFCALGFPKEIVFDEETNFLDQIRNSLSQKIDTNICFTSPHTPRENGLGDKVNETIVRVLLKMLRENVEDWDRTLPGILYALRTTPQQPTQLSPFYLMFNREPLDTFNFENNNVKKENGIDPKFIAKKARLINDCYLALSETSRCSKRTQKRSS